MKINKDHIDEAMYRYPSTPIRTHASTHATHIHRVIFKEQPEPFLTVKHVGPPERSMTIVGGFRHLKRSPYDLSAQKMGTNLIKRSTVLRDSKLLKY